MAGRLAIGLTLAAALAVGALAQRSLHRGLEVGYLLLAWGGLLALVALVRDARARLEATRATRAAAGLALLALTAIASYPLPGVTAHGAIALATVAWVDGWEAIPAWAIVDTVAVRSLETLGTSPGFLPLPLVFASACTLVARAWARRARDPIAAERRILAALAAGALLAVLGHALAWRPGFGGIDFFWIACEARDAALGPPNPDPMRFDHLPGAFRFWGIPIALLGDRVAPLQWTWVLVLGANLALAGALVFRHTRSAMLAALTMVVAYGADTRLEVFCMTSERLATIPLLVAAHLFGGRSLAGRPGRALAVGACLGLIVYLKRQGASLVLGAIAWVVLESARTLGFRAALRTGVLLGATSLATFLAPVLAEGEGLRPIFYALYGLTAHPRLGRGWGENTWSALSRVPGLFLQPLVSIVPLARLARREVDARTSIAGFLGLGATTNFAQFGMAAFAHHTLFLATSGVVAGALLFPWERLKAPLARRPGLATGLTFALVVLFLGPAGGSSFPSLPVGSAASPIAVAEPDLAPHVHRGEDLVVIPPGIAEISFRLGTIARHGPVAYTWMPHLTPPLADALDWSRVDVAAVVSRDEWTDPYHRPEALVAELPAHGFAPVVSSGPVTIWRRRP